MLYFVEIQIRALHDLTEHTIMSVLFSKLHLALVKDGKGRIGISFPDVDLTLGNRLRFHGSKEALDHLMVSDWMKGLSDYVLVSPVRQVPSPCKYRVVSRCQIKSNVERLYRRSVRKGWCTEEDARLRMQQHRSKTIDVPYLHLTSGSTGQSFRLFITHGPLLEDPVEGSFSSYGLSAMATVPWF